MKREDLTITIYNQDIYGDLKLKKPYGLHGLYKTLYNSAVRVNPFKPEFTIVIFIHYKPRIAVTILDL